MTEETNAEAKFAFPQNDVGIGYYFGGEPVSPEEFDRLVSEKADRIRSEREATRIKAEGARAGSGES